MPWFLLLVAAVATLAGTWRTRRWVGLISAAALLGLAALAWPGRPYVDWMLTELALPLGLVWFLLLVTTAVLAAMGRSRTALWVGLLWFFLSVAGNGVTARALTSSMERPYFDVDPLAAGSFDAICLLGGGADTDHSGRVKLGTSGDRVVVAARVFKAGRTPLVVCTGLGLRMAPNLPTIAEESAAALAEFGVPRETILLAGAQNTKTEIAEIRRLKKKHGWNRIGIVTSAWHMRRVERLARAAGLEFVPLPADFRTSPDLELSSLERFQRFSLMPNPGSLHGVHTMLREHLARFAGR